MKKSLAVLALLAAFYFVVERDLVPGDAVKIRFFVGPFPTLQECQAEMNNAVAGMGLAPGFRVVVECKEGKAL